MYNVNIHSKTICNNCGKQGHSYHYCKTPITSYGIVLYYHDRSANTFKYLMIRRKHSFGFVDFVRGKYTFHNIHHLQAMFDEMSTSEHEEIQNTPSFDTLWNHFWNGPLSLSLSKEEKEKEEKEKEEKEGEEKEKEKEKQSMKHNMFSSSFRKHHRHHCEEQISRKKFESLKHGIMVKDDNITIDTLISNTHSHWNETEWEFPKGRRNQQEKDMTCALREFEEETGISTKHIHVIENVVPFEEMYIGSNFKSYKHKYYLAQLDESAWNVSLDDFQQSEVSHLQWKTIDECLMSIRPYHLEKKKIITNIHSMLQQYLVQPVN